MAAVKRLSIAICGLRVFATALLLACVGCTPRQANVVGERRVVKYGDAKQRLQFGERLSKSQREHSTWLALQEHASFPAATTVCAEEELDLPRDKGDECGRGLANQ